MTWRVLSIALRWPWVGRTKWFAVLVRREDLADFVEHFEKDVEKFVIVPDEEGYVVEVFLAG